MIRRLAIALAALLLQTSVIRPIEAAGTQSVVTGPAVMGVASGTAAPVPLSSLPAGFSTVTPGVLSGNFYMPGANIWSLSDRVMVGAAALGNGQYTGYSGLPSWVAANWLFRDTQLGSIQTYGLWGTASATRTSDYTGGLQQSTGAYGGYTLNDGGRGTSRVAYLEEEHTNVSSTSVSYLIEGVIKNSSGVSNTVTPYGGSAYGSSGFSLACGGDPSYGSTANTNCNYGMLFQKSTGSSVAFNKGIVFRSDALNGTTGINGGGNAAQAIEMGYGQGIHWYSSNGSVQAGRISSVGTSSADQSHDMQFANNKVQWVNANSTNTFEIDHVSSGQNGVKVVDAISGSAPTIQPVAQGGTPDTNVALSLSGLGTSGVNTLGAFSVASLLTAPQISETGAISAAFGTSGVGLSLATQTQTDSTTAAGTVTSVYFHNIALPTFATSGNAITISNAYTLDITGCPLAGANVTITTCGGLRVGGGQAQFNGLISGGLGMTVGGGTINLNTSASSNVTNIGTGTTTGNVNIGGGSNIISAGSPIKLSVLTVSTLPSCGSSQKGELAAVSDATAPTWNSTLTGGGSVAVSAFCNGSNWVAN